MSPRSRTRLSGLVLIAAILAGCGAGEDVSPSYKDRIPPGLELESSQRTVQWGKRVTLDGRLTQGEDVLPGQSVDLEADGYPFDGQFRTVLTADTDDNGRFSFADKPDENTAYRVSAGQLSETHSNERRVYVEPRTKLIVGDSGGNAAFTTIFRHPEDHSIQGSSVYSYASTGAPGTGGPLRFVKVTTVKQRKLGLSESRIVLPYPVGGVSYTSCIGYTPDSGLGAPDDRCTQGRAPAGSDIVG